jgi:protease II
MQNAYIAVLDPESGKIVTAPEPLARRYLGSNGAPIWTPDGNTLIYAGTGLRSSVLTIRSLETGEERDIKPQLSFFDASYMVHDGRSIILQGQAKARLGGFYRIDETTNEATPIMQASSTGVPWYLSFSSDGKTLYYLNHIGAQSLKQVFKRNMETGEEKEIYRIPDSHRVQMRLSPDGRRLACIHWKRPLGVNTLFTLSPDGGESRELLEIKEPQ